jgi:FKBP-type peptidyl-prolyl cis-trans isomerase FkpA
MKYILSIIPFLLFLGCGGDDFVTTDSGLKYSDHKKGEGRAAEMGDLVTMHLSIWNIQDSTDLFEDWSTDSTRMSQLIGSSREQNQPAKVVLGSGEFIKGSDEGIVGMKPGGIRTIIIPSFLHMVRQVPDQCPLILSLKLNIELEAKPVPVVEHGIMTLLKFRPHLQV